MKRIILALGFALAFSGCAGMARGCSAWAASAAGSDWIIVQYSGMGEPFRCWTLHDVSVGNEEHSDGIYWQSPDGHLVHISGFYNRVQVSNHDWNSAFNELGLTEDMCDEIRTRHHEVP